jgi:D-psicose/D-tagatose/L-ribulose 3-epimerase
MKVGMNMLLWTGHVRAEHFALFAVLKRAGFDGLEIPVFNTEAPADFRKIRSAALNEGLQCNAITILANEAQDAVSPERARRQGAIDHMRRAIDCAHDLSAEVLAGPYYQVLGQFTGHGPTEQELTWAADFHRATADIAQAAGMSCAIEPLNRFEAYLINTTAQAAAHVCRVNHPNFGAMYDTFHANIEEKDQEAAIAELHAVGGLRHVHISENDRGTPGRGHIDFPKIIAKLKSLGYDDWLTIEAFGQALPDLAAATRIWRPLFPNPEQVYTEGCRLIRELWEAA